VLLGVCEDSAGDGTGRALLGPSHEHHQVSLHLDRRPCRLAVRSTGMWGGGWWLGVRGWLHAPCDAVGGVKVGQVAGVQSCLTQASLPSAQSFRCRCLYGGTLPLSAPWVRSHVVAVVFVCGGSTATRGLYGWGPDYGTGGYVVNLSLNRTEAWSTLQQMKSDLYVAR
jgi:hypothetical protein